MLLDVNYGLENKFGQVELRQHPVDKLWYLELPYQFEGSGMTVKLLITSEDNVLKLVDLYFGSKDGVDTFATGHPADRNVRDPHLWEDEDWVKDVFIKLKDFEKTIEEFDFLHLFYYLGNVSEKLGKIDHY